MTAAPVPVLWLYQALFPGVRLPDEDAAAAAVREVADRLGVKVAVFPADWPGHLVVGQRGAEKLARAEEARRAADQAVVEAAVRADSGLPSGPLDVVAREGLITPQAGLAAKLNALRQAGATAGQIGDAMRRRAETM